MVDVGTAVALFIAVASHELGHFGVARIVGGQAPLVLQVGGGRAYLKNVEGLGPTVAVLVAGGLAGLAPFTASLYLEYFGAKLREAIWLWTIYQWLPFPTLDGGQILDRTLLVGVKRSLVRSRILWVAGFVTVIGIGFLLPGLSRPLLYFTAMAMLLGRSEAGAMRYQDAYEAWERGEHRAVIERVKKAPRFFNDDEMEAIALLGLASARSIDDREAMLDLAETLAPYHPERVRTAETLLRAGHESGPPLANDAFTAYDQGRIGRDDIDPDLWADLAFHAATAEAAEGHDDAALALLERAETFGFDHLDRLQAEPRLSSLEALPRYQAVVSRLQKAAGAEG